MQALIELENDLAGVMRLEDLAGEPLARLQRLSGASGSFLFGFDAAGAPRSLGGSLVDPMRDYTPDLFAEDPVQSHALQFSPQTFLSTPETPFGRFDIPAFLRSRPYTDFYRPNEIGFLQGVWPTGHVYGAERMFGVLLSTPRVDQPFEEPKLRMLRYLEQPFRAAARRIERFRAIEHERDVLRELVTRARGAVVLWDHELRLVWMSPEAAALLDSTARADLERGVAAAARQLRRRRSVPVASILGRAQLLHHARGAPLSAELSWIGMPGTGRWLMAEVRQSHVDGQAPAAKLESLTRSERRVLELLARGLSNRELGRKLFVSEETIKTHVKRILAKLGVSSRAKAASVARDARLDPEPRPS